MEQYIEQLYKFLEIHEAKEEFLAAFAEEEPDTSLFDYYVDMNTAPTSMISAVFTWSETPSGTHYWSKLSDKWRSKVEN